jgi:hypothetical protein
VGLTNSQHKSKNVAKTQTEHRTLTDSLDKRPKRRNKDMRFWTWNVRSSLVTVPDELSNYKLDLVGVQEVKWEGGDT